MSSTRKPSILGESTLSPDQMRRLADRLRREADESANRKLALALRKRAAEWEDRAALTEIRHLPVNRKRSDAPRK